MIARSTLAPEPLRCPQRHGQYRFVMLTLAPRIVLLVRGGGTTEPLAGRVYVT
jgi:hypothetical protein